MLDLGKTRQDSCTSHRVIWSRSSNPTGLKNTDAPSSPSSYNKSSSRLYSAVTIATAYVPPGLVGAQETDEGQ